MQKFVFVYKLTGVSLVEQSLSLSSSMAIPYKKEHQGQLEESGMAPRYWLQVLDHLVAVSKMSKD